VLVNNENIVVQLCDDESHIKLANHLQFGKVLFLKYTVKILFKNRIILKLLWWLCSYDVLRQLLLFI